MRFHCGISFSWKSIKKFLFPILIGLLAYFGFNFINDNNSIPLGFIKVNALENYDTKYIIDYSNVSNYVSMDIDNSHHKLVDLVNSINSNSNISREYTIVVSTSQNNITRIDLYVFDSSLSYSFSIFGYNFGGTGLIKSYIYPSSLLTGKLGYYIDTSTLSDNIFNTTFYTNTITCLTGGNCDSNSTFNSVKNSFSTNSSISNTTNKNVFYDTSLDLYFYFYSSKDLILTNDYRNDQDSYIYKTLSIDNVDYGIGDKFPTYYDLYLQPTPDEPDEPVEPDNPDSDTEHKALFNKIYWFDDNSSTIGILSSIYILLFLYCFTMIIFRILTFIKNMRW